MLVVAMTTFVSGYWVGRVPVEQDDEIRLTVDGGAFQHESLVSLECEWHDPMGMASGRGNLLQVLVVHVGGRALHGDQDHT